MKGFVSLILIVILLLSYGCVKNNSMESSRKKTVQIVVKRPDSDYWHTVRLGAETAGQEFDINIKVNSPKNEDDISGQIEIINNAIESKVDGIVLAACDYKQLVPVTERAIKAGIPVVIIDSELDYPKVSSFIATDNIQAGKLAGRKLVELVGDKADIAIINFVKGAATAVQREEGLMEVLKAYPEINIVAKEYSLSDEKRAEELTRKIFERFGKVDAIVALNGYSAVGTARALEELGATESVKIVAFDSFKEEIDYLEDEVIDATVVQNPFSMGYLGVKTVLEALDRKEIPKYIDTGSKIIDKSNMYLPENQKLLFPFVE